MALPRWAWACRRVSGGATAREVCGAPEALPKLKAVNGRAAGRQPALQELPQLAACGISRVGKGRHLRHRGFAEDGQGPEHRVPLHGLSQGVDHGHLQGQPEQASCCSSLRTAPPSTSCFRPIASPWPEETAPGPPAPLPAVPHAHPSSPCFVGSPLGSYRSPPSPRRISGRWGSQRSGE